MYDRAGTHVQTLAAAPAAITNRPTWPRRQFATVDEARDDLRQHLAQVEELAGIDRVSHEEKTEDHR